MKPQTKRFLYAVLAADNDVQAIKKKKIARRIARRIYGRVTGRIARKLFG